jgi:hypothetical protein
MPTLTINVYPAGTGSTSVETSSTYKKITAIPNSGYAFARWSGDYTGTYNPTDWINLTVDKTVNCWFAINNIITKTTDILTLDHSSKIADQGIIQQTIPIIGLDHLTVINKELPIGVAMRYKGASYTNLTTQANEDTVNDVPLFESSPAVNDGFYFGTLYKGLEYMRLMIYIGTAGVGTWTLTWYYWNGSAWTALPSVNIIYKMSGLTDFKTAGYAVMVIIPPSDMALKNINSLIAYYLEARITSFSSKTTNPLADRIWFAPDYALGGCHWKRYGGIISSRNGNTQLGSSIRIW